MLRQILRRLSYLNRRSRFELELDDEVRFHLDTRATELEGAGMSRKDALLQARREFGPKARAGEDARAAWQFKWLEDVGADLRYAARSFARRPSFAMTAASCLALGIGANALIFSLVNAALLRALPYPEADRIVSVRFSPPNQPDQKLGTNSGSYFFVRQHSSVFQKMGAIRITGFSVTSDPAGDAPAEWVQGGWVSPGLTDVMGVPPIIGRWFALDDTDFNIVISQELWQKMYGGTPDVLGKKLYLDRAPATIVGVMPTGYQTLNSDIDLWRSQPDQNLANALRSPNRVFNVFGRLKPGVTVEQARAELTTLNGPLGEDMEMNRGWTIRVDSLRESYVGYLRQPLLVLQGAVLLVLLIACANVGGLLLAQAAARQKELAMRAALGSSRGRILRQLLTENVLLALTGGLLGVALAWVGLRTIVNTALASNRDLHNVSLDWNVVGFVVLISLFTGLICGALPALQISRPDLMDVVRETGRSMTSGTGRSRLRGAFVVAQVALALVLLAGCGLLIRSLVRLNAVDPGMDPRHLVALQIPFSRSFYRGTGQNTATGGLLVEFDSRFSQLSERIRERLATVPGVESVTAAVTPPLGGNPRRVRFSKPGELVAEREQGVWTGEWYPASPGYFETLKIPVKQGRSIAVQDTETARPAVVINATLARRFFAGDDPIGRQIQLDVLNDPPREIIGVVGDVNQDRFQSAPQPQIYVPRTQVPHRMDMTMSFEILVVNYVVRSSGDPEALVPSLRGAIRDVDRSVAISSVRTVEEYAAVQLQDLSQYAALLSLFGAISVTLALVGIFGVMAHTVSQRTNEIGIRLALGAKPTNVLGLILRQGSVLIGAGIALGFGVSLLLTPLIRSVLRGISVDDPLTYIVVILGLALVAMLACYLPARRALRVDPMIALRTE